MAAAIPRGESALIAVVGIVRVSGCMIDAYSGGDPASQRNSDEQGQRPLQVAPPSYFSNAAWRIDLNRDAERQARDFTTGAPIADRQYAIGKAKITGPGVDAVERGVSATLEIQFPNKPAPAILDVPSPWQGPLAPDVAGVLNSAQPASFLEPAAPLEVRGEIIQAALSAASAEPAPQREVLTLKPTFMGMSVDLKELARRAVTWSRARR